MPLTLTAAAQSAAMLPLFAAAPAPDKVAGLFHAASLIERWLGQGKLVDAAALRSAMEAAFGASDAAGAWLWKDAYEASEAAQVLFLRKYGAAMRTRAGTAPAPNSIRTRTARLIGDRRRRERRGPPAHGDLSLRRR